MFAIAFTMAVVHRRLGKWQVHLIYVAVPGGSMRHVDAPRTEKIRHAPVRTRSSGLSGSPGGPGTTRPGPNGPGHTGSLPTDPIPAGSLPTDLIPTDPVPTDPVPNSPIATGPRRRNGRAACGLRGLNEKAGWYLPLALSADAVGIGLPVALLFDAAHQPHPVLCAVMAAAAWLCVEAGRLRYMTRALGESRHVLPLVYDWLILLGVLAVARALLREASEPTLALLALAPGPVVTGACRLLTYRHLRSARRAAQAVRRVVVIGEPSAADLVVEHLATRTDHEYVVVGTVSVGPAGRHCGSPVVGRLRSVPSAVLGQDSGAVLAAAAEHAADLVLVVPGPRMAGERLRRLSWALHDAGLPLAVLPGLTEVSVRRVELASAAGLTLLHVTPPVRRGMQVALKTVVDRCGAALGLLALIPLFALIATAIRLSSPGPVFHRQIRYGRNRTPFTMWKFRTMVVDAENRKAELAAQGANENDGLMFKMRHDPRVTPVGRLLRRCSLDELPQLFNVLRGEMSLVGPRPPLPDEVAGYDEVELRRLAVKPGLTGLWQVNGRSDLSWDETVALDLRYVDNWSFTGDMDVMARTIRAVVDGRGAY
jgi:exopolysaccharide biosynthesis polyprenyl glycosylphosphotransferase